MIPETGTVFDERYKIIKLLGKGGFASTYLCDDLKTNEKVVLKFPDITQLGDPAVYERFKREISIGKIMTHPDLPVAIAYSEGNPPYLVINYVDGKSLDLIIKEKGRFEVNEAIKLISNLLEALQCCHEHGVFHRDIKPENLMLGSDGHLKIIDFGIASIKGAPRVTYRGFSGLMGTPEYMSPEQIKGERGGAKSDIYAVGCVMYHMLAGNPPFTGDNPLTTMYQHMTSDIKPLTSIRNDVKPELWAVIKRSLRRRKEERYNSAAEMISDLKNPDKVDLSWIDKNDPPLASVVSTKKTSWIAIIAAILAVIAIIIVIIIYKK
ncbi:serine/threonine-protein kinase [Clostridium neuense]|uniref:Serine/threonine-protein kinase n=1 Tax=Clostridium neuense TaxID=1728934 RepID=A0ABW8TEC1_9CLOT